ncbi:glycosyltransferase [Evansella sp. AB-rgal1]|uniref:CgeB family protein n=1 Tax=Evansella sp. AB-rgal1 TaxID=3242696 RepID=UPI00359DCAF0
MENFVDDVNRTGVEKYLYDKSVLYVPKIYRGTYEVINEGIMDQLKNQVREVYIAKQEENIVILAAQIKPDLVLVLLGDTFPTDQVKAIREMGIKTAVWFTDDPYFSDVSCKIAPYYQYVFTQEISCVSQYQLLGIPHVHYLPLASNTKYFHYQHNNNQNIDVCFMGAAWNNRLSMFDEIAHSLAKKNVIIVGYHWNRMKNYHLLSEKVRHTILSPEESASLINQSKIVINHHRSFDDSTFFSKNSNKLPGLSINPRTFEISACSAFQLTDIRQELSRYFQLGKEIETYSSPLELIEKIDYYLVHEDERKQVAKKAYNITKNNHTYYHRIRTLLKVVFAE